jgi:hypothetical protein
MPIFFSVRDRLHAVRRAVGQHARHEHQVEPVRRALRLVRRGRVAREHEMDAGAAVRDEDLLAVDEVAIAVLHDLRDDAAEVRAGLRLGEIHRALVLARGELREVALLRRVVAVLLDVERDAGLEPMIVMRLVSARDTISRYAQLTIAGSA